MLYQQRWRRGEWPCSKPNFELLFWNFCYCHVM